MTKRWSHPNVIRALNRRRFHLDKMWEDRNNAYQEHQDELTATSGMCFRRIFVANINNLRITPNRIDMLFSASQVAVNDGWYFLPVVRSRWKYVLPSWSHVKDLATRTCHCSIRKVEVEQPPKSSTEGLAEGWTSFDIWQDSMNTLSKRS